MTCGGVSFVCFCLVGFFFNFTEDVSPGLFRESGKQATRQLQLLLNVNEMNVPEGTAI